jgi:DNA processing protein
MDFINTYLSFYFLNISENIKRKFLKNINFDKKSFLDFFEKYKILNLNAVNLLKDLEFKDIKIISPFSKLYPLLLLETNDFPLILFAKGNLDLLTHEKKIAIVGSREPTTYGIKATKFFSSSLVKEDFCIVSGMAKGIDGIAHTACLEKNGKTIAVLGTGVDVVYPKQNRNIYKNILESGGLIISEFLPGFLARPKNFPRRNRIIAGISKGVIVVEAKEKSGSLISARLSSSYGRAVFSVPGGIFSLNSSGTNKLIKQGAIVTNSIEDVLSYV